MCVCVESSAVSLRRVNWMESGESGREQCPETVIYLHKQRHLVASFCYFHSETQPSMITSLFIELYVSYCHIQYPHVYINDAIKLYVSLFPG